MNNNAKTASNNTSFQKYYGIGAFQPILVNPNAKDLGEFLNRQMNSEPQYLINKSVDGKQVQVLRLDIWGIMPKINVKTKVTFWLEGRLDISQAGKFKFINGQGLTTYVEDVKILNKNKLWYYGENMRKCIKGEDYVIDFFIKLMNWETNLSKFDVEKNDIPEIFLPVKKLFEGDYSELQKCVNEQRTIKVYCGIKARQKDENTYYDMEIYSRAFSKDNPNKKGAIEITNALTGGFANFSGNIAPLSDTLEEFDINNIKAPNNTNGDSDSSDSNYDIPDIFK